MKIPFYLDEKQKYCGLLVDNLYARILTFERQKNETIRQILPQLNQEALDTHIILGIHINISLLSLCIVLLHRDK